MVAGVALCGCDSLDSRISKHREYYNGLGAAKQERLRQYVMVSGDTMRDVEIGLGVPDRRYTDSSGMVTFVYKRSLRSIEVDRDKGGFKDGPGGMVITEVCFRGDRLYKSREIIDTNQHHLSEGSWSYF